MKDLIESQNTLRFIKEHHISAKKKFGQNFLVDKAVLDVIISGSEITKEDNILEIGPGIGTLSQALCKASGRVLLVEIDLSLIPFLKENLSFFDNFEIIQADFLKLDIKEELRKRNIKNIKICANLPYYITTAILTKLFKDHVPARTITVTVQKEVAARMIADPGGKDYGVLTLWIKYFSSPSLLMDVSRESFFPVPKVDSAVVRLKTLKDPQVSVLDEDIFFKFLKAVFSKRRKTLINSIKDFRFPRANNKNTDPAEISKILARLELSLDIRGESLSLEQFAMLFNSLYSLSLS